MWKTVDFERYLINSADHLHGRRAAGDGVRQHRRLRARALPVPRRAAVRRWASIGTQLIPGSMFLLPVFIGFIWLKQNTPDPRSSTRALGMILVYTAFFTPVAIYFMRSFFLAIPRDLEEAAHGRRLHAVRGVRADRPARRAAPGLVATFVYAFLFAWDELLFVAALTQHNAETIPIGIRNFIGNYSQDYGAAHGRRRGLDAPGRCIAFFATQRWLVRGHHRGGGEGMTTIDPQALDLGGEPDAARSRRRSASAPRRRRTRSRAPCDEDGRGESIWDRFCAHARARSPTATPATSRATTTTAGRPTST